MKFAFTGFRHSHIMSLYNTILKSEDLQIVAACEEDTAARETLKRAGYVHITHCDYMTMLHEVECDAVAVGDYYSKHGQIIIEALRVGKHVITDKPLCTSLDEFDRIEALAKEKNLSVQCMFDLRGLAPYITLKRILDDGVIGDVHTIMFQGLHPLLRNSRPAWYFEDNKQGGTINEIAVHGIDLALWLTSQSTATVLAARAWNAACSDIPKFQDAAQLMLRLGNGCGVIGDISYLAPDRCGYKGEQYWRTCCHGSNGMAETFCTADSVKIATHTDEGYRQIPLLPQSGPVYLESLLMEAHARQGTPALTTQEVLCASQIALDAQQKANQFNM